MQVEGIHFRKHRSSRSPHILLRSSWQTVNIGDISHTPGMLGLLRQYFPEAVVTLWPDRLDRGVRALLLREFPRLRILDSVCWEKDRPVTEELGAAFAAADFLLHGSGPSVVGAQQIEDWVRYTGKPYGIYGVTVDPLSVDPVNPDQPAEGAALSEQWRQVNELPADHISPRLKHLLDAAQFVYCRDTLSLTYLRRQKVACPILDFAPDAAFGLELRDDLLADQFLEEHGLEPNKFLCVIPRLRYTPYHLTHNVSPTRRDRLRAEFSDRYREQDMSKLREAITLCVRLTGLKVLLCPEMTYQIELAKTGIFDLLPEDVKRHTIWRSTYWLPGEACSVFARSRLLVSMDNHSPIFALSLGLPTVVLRQPTDTIKGQMWRDLSLGDWLLEMDEVDGRKIFARVYEIHDDYARALERVTSFRSRVQEHQTIAMSVLKETFPPTPAARSLEPSVERVQ